MINIKNLKKLLNLLQGTDISELEIEESGEKIKIKRGVASTVFVQKEASSPELKPAPPLSQSPSIKEEKENGKVKKELNITSPFVGTFYRSHTPGNTPYVEEGSLVKKGDILCIVEAMKLMNEIESDHEGKVTAILAENGNPVEYGQALFQIHPLEN